ncbi:MAG: T9SS type A sorting domain-containing protein [Bacteroidetes bacterium]|nr:T9SS type A sorting domain-containing protein [Bacteroidota bacterium]MBS1939925.1 T9SS type A sorting domain-containing protein [Bacteroidota bacterium]
MNLRIHPWLPLLSLIMVASPAEISAQYERYQYFDGSDTIGTQSILILMDPDSTNLWQVGPPQKPLFNSAATLPNALVTDTIGLYSPGNTSMFSFTYVPEIPWGLLALQWKQKIDLTAGVDVGMLEFSVDSGSTWSNVFTSPFVYNLYGFDPGTVDTVLTGDIGFTGTDTTWRDIWLCFDMSWIGFEGGITFRYSLEADTAGLPHEGWMIDNMMLHSTFMHPVKEMAQPAFINVYPNPATDRVGIVLRPVGEYQLIEHMYLSAMDGRIVKAWAGLPSRFWFDTEALPKGTYYLSIRTNLRSETFPIVIQ